MKFKCTKCGHVITDGYYPCPNCGETKLEEVEDNSFLIEWDNRNSLNPYAVTLSSGSATLSSSIVIEKFPETWESFKKWSQQEKTSDIIGDKGERVALLYSGKTEGIMETVATHIATKLDHTVVTAPYIYERGTGKRLAFQPKPRESLNQFIKRFISEARHAIILYTEQGGQIIETAFCSDMAKHTLGLVNFYRGSGKPINGEILCPFYKDYGSTAQCVCNPNDNYGEKVCGHICSASKIFCRFTEQELSKMVFDFYITSPEMYLFGADNIENLKKPIEPFLAGKIDRR